MTSKSHTENGYSDYSSLLSSTVTPTSPITTLMTMPTSTESSSKHTSTTALSTSQVSFSSDRNTATIKSSRATATSSVTAASDHYSDGDSGLGARAEIPAILLPVMAFFLALLGLSFYLIYRRRRRQERKNQGKVPKSMDTEQPKLDEQKHGLGGDATRGNETEATERQNEFNGQTRYELDGSSNEVRLQGSEGAGGGQGRRKGADGSTRRSTREARAPVITVHGT